VKLLPTNVGAQPKQVAILAGLIVLLVVVYFLNHTPSSPEAAAVPRSETPPAPSPLGPRSVPQVPMPPQRTSTRAAARGVEDFRPSLKLSEGTDVSRIDPTLHLDLLAKLREVPMEGGARSLFEFSQPPAPPPPKVTIKPAPVVPPPPKPAAPEADAKPAPPPPPPIPLKFYGYATPPRSGPKRAFFLDGDDIFVAGENDLIRNRYKIIRIGVNSAVVEDTTNKHQQTLPLVEELAG
jgi:hypothetical protein